MDQQKRLLLFIVLSLVVMLLWGELYGPKRKMALLGAADGGVADGGPAAVAPPGAADAGVAAAPPLVPPAARPAEQRVEIETDEVKLGFTSYGGAIKEASLKGRKNMRKRGKETVPVELVRSREGDPLPGTVLLPPGLPDLRQAVFEVERRGDGVSFLYRDPSGLEVRKKYTVRPKGHVVDLEVELKNGPAALGGLQLSFPYATFIDPAEEKTGGFLFSAPVDVTRAVCFAADRVERFTPSKKEQSKVFEGPVHFVGIDERYFLGAMYPKEALPSRCTLEAEEGGFRQASMTLDLGALAPSARRAIGVGFYLGPKDIDQLKAVSLESLAPGAVAPVDPDLERSIDLGWWAVIGRVLLLVMKQFHKLVHNWGVSVLLLTVLVKGLLFPLTQKSMKSMEQMRKLQPQVEVIRKKYEADREKMNLEMMNLYRQHGVSMFGLGGCLPILVQMPVWLALYTALNASFELYREPFIAVWISDLTARDPYFILPLAMGITMFVTQKMQPQVGDPTQAKMMLYVMPIFFTFIMFNLPAGLTLYMFCNNLLSIGQQWYLRKSMQPRTA